MNTRPIKVAVVGLGFGAEFAAIYHRHPQVSDTVIVDENPDRLSAVGGKFDIDDRRDRLEPVLDDPSIDAVHIATAIPDHAAHTIAVLESGKHCACAVPMATTLDDLEAIVDAVRRTHKNYMMMETTVYDRTFLWVREQLHKGAFGDIQLLRGAHYQDMENWPAYWAGLPPMWYATHAVSPLLALAETRATEVHCYGSGVMREELTKMYNNPYPIETAVFRLDGVSAAAEVTRALFHCARPYVESFNLYGTDATFEWQQNAGEQPMLYTQSPLGEGPGPRRTTTQRITVPDYADRLPDEIARFTMRGVYDDNDPHLSFAHGGGHGGSHPHLCHEFVQSIVRNRKPAIDEVTGANWTAPGICAHESALLGGQRVEIPRFDSSEIARSANR